MRTIALPDDKDLFKNNFVLLQPNHGNAKRGLMT